MSQIEDAPFVRILLAAELAGATADYGDRAGTGADVTVRQRRNRNPVRGERPALSLIYVSDEPRPDDIHLNAWEQVRVFTFDVQADADLDAEDAGTDRTGLALLARMIATFRETLVSKEDDPNHPVFLAGLVDEIYAGEFDPSDRSTPDEGRLTQAIHVVYRVRSDNSNVLLSQGANL